MQVYIIKSCIDYCNSLLCGVSDYNINRLQQIQNSAAHIVTNTQRYDHVAPILQKLYWLPVKQCIDFKILLITNNLSMIWHLNTCVNWYPLEISGHPVRYYCRCLCLSSTRLPIVGLVLQPPLCGIGCQQILEMCHLFF